MPTLNSLIFKPLQLKRCLLPNRLIRSATYEGMADAQGYPQKELTDLYLNLTASEPVTVITGFVAISRQGRAMQPRQGGIGDDSFIAAWRELTRVIKSASPESRLFMQLAHSGRQTLKSMTGWPVVGASSKKCTYFRQKTHALSEDEIEAIIADFAAAARRAKAAGFDGIQIHAAHGYLIHQFISPYTNPRAYRWAGGGLLLSEIVKAVDASCGPDFPVMVKASHSDDRGLTARTAISALKQVESRIDAVEVSYGTMEYALNIIRGACPIDEILKINPLYSSIPAPLKSIWKACVYPFKKAMFKPFTYQYNLDGAMALKKELRVPIIPVGGLHRLEDIATVLKQGFEAASLSRPFIREPDLMAKIKSGCWLKSPCSRCNLCAVNCDGPGATYCRRSKEPK